MRAGELDQVCRWVPKGHRFAAHLEPFRRVLGTWQQEGRLQPRDGETMLTRTLLRASPDFDLKWIYKSVQFSTEESFRAWTFLYRRERNETAIYEFPKDSKLRGLQEYLEPIRGRDQGEKVVQGIKVLRYVPRRRFTFFVSRGKNLRAPSGSIGKVVRPSEAERLYGRLGALEEGMGSVRFGIARLLELDEKSNLFFQEKQPGCELSKLIATENLESLLRKAGEIHAEIHDLNLPRAHEWHSSAYFQRAEGDRQWVESFYPERRALLYDAWKIWIKRAPAFPPDRFVVCHGDFRASHLLVGEQDRWSVVDFDGCLHADPCWDMAWFLSALRRDVPFIANATVGPSVLERAEQSYLKGYQNVRGFSAPRLAWFRLAEEIHFLARSFQRDLWDEAAVEQTLHRLRELTGNLQ